MSLEKAPYRIIVVEDEESSRRLLVRQLEKAGYAVQSFENGKEATQSILEMRSGIVISDWQMPVMDGIGLVRFVRGMESMHAVGSIYFVLLTANSETDSLVTGLDSGADEYLTKPYCKEELLARIRAGVRIVDLQEELVSRQVALVRANLELELARKRLSQMASTDSLTQLNNRRALLDRLEDHWALAERYGRPLCCIMVDVDRFKSVNDTYGHHTGDVVLRTVATMLRECLRRHDVCGRLGGEEFCIVCPETPLEGAVIVAERLREAIAARVIDAGDHTLQVTASFGVAVRGDSDSRSQDMINRADAMLYKAKENGRNQVWTIDAGGRAERAAAAGPIPVAASAS